MFWHQGEIKNIAPFDTTNLASIFLGSAHIFSTSYILKCASDTFSLNSCCRGCGFIFPLRDELKKRFGSFESSAVAATAKYVIMNCYAAHSF
jgi:hypothetical protein